MKSGEAIELQLKVYIHNEYKDKDKDRITNLIALSNGTLCASSNNKSIKTFQLNLNTNSKLTSTNYKRIINIENAHTSSIFSICEIPSLNIATILLLSSSLEGDIKLWNITNTTYTLQLTIPNAHNGAIYKLTNISPIQTSFASCSEDRSIKLWNITNTYNPLTAVLKGHKDEVSSIIQPVNIDDTIVSVSYDNDLRFWNCKRYTCITVIHNIDCSSMNAVVNLKNKHIAIGGNELIYIVDPNKRCLLESIKCEPFDGYITALCTYRDTFFTMFNKKLYQIRKDVYNRNEYYKCYECERNKCFAHEALCIISNNYLASSNDNNEILIFYIY